MEVSWYEIDTRYFTQIQSTCEEVKIYSCFVYYVLHNLPTRILAESTSPSLVTDSRKSSLASPLLLWVYWASWSFTVWLGHRLGLVGLPGICPTVMFDIFNWRATNSQSIEKLILNQRWGHLISIVTHVQTKRNCGNLSCDSLQPICNCPPICNPCETRKK